MSAGLDARPGRRAERWVAPVGLCGGAVCLLAGAVLHLGAEPAAPTAAWAEGTGDAAPAALQNDMSRPNERPQHGTVEQIEPSVGTPTREEIERPRAGRFGQAAPDAPPETRLRAAIRTPRPAGRRGAGDDADVGRRGLRTARLDRRPGRDRPAARRGDPGIAPRPPRARVATRRRRPGPQRPCRCSRDTGPRDGTHGCGRSRPRRTRRRSDRARAGPGPSRRRADP